MTVVTVNYTFEAPASVGWPVISDFGGLEKLVRRIKSFRTEGEGLGIQRYIDMGDGDIVERLTWLDDATITFSFTMLTSPLPISRHVSTVRLVSHRSVTDVEWRSSFVAPGADERDAIDSVEAGHGIRSVKRAIGA